MDGLYLISIDVGLEDYIEYDGSAIQINGGPRQVRHVENAVLESQNDLMNYVVTFRESITDAYGALNGCLSALDGTVDALERVILSCNYDKDETVNYTARCGKARVIVQIYRLGSRIEQSEESYSHSVIFQYSESEEEDVAQLTQTELLDGEKVKEFLEVLLDEYKLTDRVIPSANVYVDLIQAMFADVRLHESEATCVIPLVDEEEVTVILVPERTNYSMDTVPPTEGAVIH